MFKFDNYVYIAIFGEVINSWEVAWQEEESLLSIRSLFLKFYLKFSRLIKI